MTEEISTGWDHLDYPNTVRSRARDLASAHMKMKSDLIDIRIERRMSQQDVADVLGVPVKKITNFERYDSNPRLETVRKYANAVGAFMESNVWSDETYE